MATKCIICGGDKRGTPVYEDVVIRFIRKLKQTINIAQNNRLVVCKDCMEEHLKRRSKFEKTLVMYGAFGLIVIVVFLLITQTLTALFGGIFILCMMLLFALVSYHPSLIEYPKKSGKSKKK